MRATAARRRAAGTRPAYRDRVFADLGPAAPPRPAALGPRRAGPTARDTYATGPRALVDGLLAGRRAAAGRGIGSPHPALIFVEVDDDDDNPHR